MNNCGWIPVRFINQHLHLCRKSLSSSSRLSSQFRYTHRRVGQWPRKASIRRITEREVGSIVSPSPVAKETGPETTGCDGPTVLFRGSEKLGAESGRSSETVLTWVQIALPVQSECYFFQADGVSFSKLLRKTVLIIPSSDPHTFT